MDFTFDDGKQLCALLKRQEVLVDKKRRWLASMIPQKDGHNKKVKRPKFLRDAYLPEFYIRSEEASCKKVRAVIEKSFCSERNDYTHHVVKDGLQLFNLKEKGKVVLDPEYLGIMDRIVSKLSYEALQSVACIVSHNKFSFDNPRREMEMMVKSNLPRYLTNLDNEDITSQLFNIFRNPYSYRAAVRLVTPVSSKLLSTINPALAGLDGMPAQVLLAMNRKLREKSFAPKFGEVARFSKKGHVVEAVRGKCNKILEGCDYLPERLAKAMSVMNLYQKQKSGSIDISQSEFFPFPKETLSKQNDILNAIWALQKLRHDKLKLVRPILDQDSMVQNMHFKVALRNYLTECLFECDEADLPDEALRAISFINQISRRKFTNQISRHQQAMFTEERTEAEVDAVLNLSSHLRALAHCCTAECSCDEELIVLGNGGCNEGNDFVLSETNYLNLSPEQPQMPELCCSNNISDTDVMRECFEGSTVGATHNVSRSEDRDSYSAELVKKPCERIENVAGPGMQPDTQSGDASHLKKSRCSNINEICDETSIVAHNLIGHMLDTWLFVENNGVDEFIKDRLGGGSVSQGLQDDNVSPNPVENLERDILIHSVKSILPNLSKRFAPSFSLLLRRHIQNYLLFVQLHRQSQEDNEPASHVAGLAAFYASRLQMYHKDR